MKLITAELKKLLTGRFLCILAVALVANILLFWHQQTVPDWSADPMDMLAAQKAVLALDADARYDWVKERVRMLDACHAWELYDGPIQNGSADAAITNDMRRYRSVYENGTYLEFSTTLAKEREIFKDIFSEMQRIRDHRTMLESAIEEARMKTSFAIFAKPGTFAYRSQTAAIRRLEGLLHIQPAYDISQGVLNAQDSAATDLLGLMLVLYICVEIIVTEHRSGILPILRATRQGRLPLILAKLTAVLLLYFGVVIVFWGSNLAFNAGMFGLGDLSRPVQSLKGFSSCTLELSVGGYVVLFFLLKWLLYAVVGIAGMVLGVVLQNAAGVWLSMGGFLSVEYLLMRVIPTISAGNIFRYVNISNMIFSRDWLAEYRDLNFFGYPAAVLAVCCVLLVTVLVLGILGLCLLFCGRKTYVAPRVEFRIRWPSFLPRPGQSTVLFGHEMWKLLIECGTLVVLILFASLNLQEPWSINLSTGDLYYKNYMETLAGPMSLEKEGFLQSEVQRFARIRQQMAQLERSFAEGKITKDDKETLQQPLKRMLEAEKVLSEQVYPRVFFVREQLVKGKEAWLVYEPGYTYLFGLDQYHNKTGAVTLLVAGIILSFANIYPLETASGMQSLLNVYTRGRKATAWSKIILCLLLTTVLFVISQIPDYWYLAKNYGFANLNAPLCSLYGFSGWSDSVSILGGILIFEGLRLMSAMALALMVMAICQWVRNQLLALCITTGLLLLPLLLHLLGTNFLDNVSFYRPLTGTSLLCEKNPLPLCLLYYGTAAALGGVSILQILRRARRGAGYRRPARRK